MKKLDKETGEIFDTVTDELVAMAPPFFKTPWNHNTDFESNRTALTCLDATKTQQHLAAEQDINNILAKFMRTGELATVGNPVYQDLPDVVDLQDQMVTSWQVEEAWQNLSAEVRNTLKDPNTFVKYVEHCLERGDLSELEKLGLAKPQAPEPPPPPTGDLQAPEGGQTA